MDEKLYYYESYDVAVIGAGHAGCEAALACARLGLNTIMFTVSMDSIALMPCNPNIGGTSKVIWFEKLMPLVVKWVRILIKLIFSQKC